jgi:hypothetical protein
VSPILLGSVAVGLVPWMLRLGRVLPEQAVAHNWPLAWIGLDALMATGCASTAMLIRRRDGRAQLTAVATATVCVLDAWLDVTTSAPGAPLAESLLCAVGELSLAAYCVVVARPGAKDQPVPAATDVDADRGAPRP